MEDRGIIVFDGAMGTMLFKRGLFINRCYDQANLTNGEMVRDIHREYVQAGAMVIETNTFGAGRYKLQAFDLGDKVVEINRKGAALARAAISRATACRCSQAVSISCSVLRAEKDTRST